MATIHFTPAQQKRYDSCITHELTCLWPFKRNGHVFCRLHSPRNEKMCGQALICEKKRLSYKVYIIEQLQWTSGVAAHLHRLLNCVPVVIYVNRNRYSIAFLHAWRPSMHWTMPWPCYTWRLRLLLIVCRDPPSYGSSASLELNFLCRYKH